MVSIEELRRSYTTDLILSMNVDLRRDGLPYANYKEPIDPGVAVYFNRTYARVI